MLSIILISVNYRTISSTSCMSKLQYQGQLFNEPASSETNVLQKAGLDIEYRQHFVDQALAQTWFELLLAEVPWQQDEITVYGKKHLTPRLSCWMGESWMSYTYSRHTMRPRPWQALPLEIMRFVEAATDETFNSVLINYYRDGRDSNGWHADDEPELGIEPVIASLSLGASRDFHLRNKSDHSQKYKMRLEHGSLLIMRGQTQSCWQHHVPKRVNVGPRVNLTFRTIVRRSNQ